MLVYAQSGAAVPAAYRRWTDIVTSSALPMVVMGDFNKDALRDPQLSQVIKEWGYQVQQPRWAWTRRGAGAHAGQYSMIDFVPIRAGMSASGMYAGAHQPPVGGGGGLLGGPHPARLGVLPRPAQVAHRQVPEHQWERFARDHESWSSTWGSSRSPPPRMGGADVVDPM